MLNTIYAILCSLNSMLKAHTKNFWILGDEYELKIQLEEQKRAVDEKYRYKQRQIRELQEDIQVNTKSSK